MERTITPVNSYDRDWTGHRYILSFGAYGDTLLMIWASSLDDALDEAIDWIVDNAPGLLADEAVSYAFTEALCAGHSEDEAHEISEVDTTVGGNCGHYLHSHEWGIVAEDPTRAQILALQGRTP